MNHFKRTKSNDIVDLSILFPNVINKISISSTIQASSNLFKPQKSLSPTATNDEPRPTIRNARQPDQTPPCNVLISRKTIIFESTRRPPTRERSIRG